MSDIPTVPYYDYSTSEFVSTSDGPQVGPGGQLRVYDGGTVIDAVVEGQGALLELQGGVSDNTFTADLGTERVDYGGSASDPVIGSGGIESVLGGGAEGASVEAGGLLFVASDGLGDTGYASDTTVESGGVALVAANAELVGTVVQAGGVLITFAYDNTTVETIDGEVVETDLPLAETDPGVATSIFVESGGAVALDGGVLTGATFESGAFEYIGGPEPISGGIATVTGQTVIGNVVPAGVTEVVFSGNTVSGSIIQSGGAEYVSSGGIASGTTVMSGATQYIEADATVSDVQVESGGTDYDLSGGADDDTMISAGGTLYVSSGGGESDVTDGGTEVILASGSGGGITVDNSGILSFTDSTATGANTVYAGGVVVFTGGATAGTAGFEVQAVNGAQFVSNVLAVASAGTPFPRLEVSDFAASMRGAVLFQDSSTAGAATINVNSGGFAWFEDSANAGLATITATTSSGAIGFTNSSTAGSSTIDLGGFGAAFFLDASTAGAAQITLSGTATSGGTVLFANSANAGSATIDNLAANADVGGLVAFAGNATAGAATIDNEVQITTPLSRELAQIRADFTASVNTPGAKEAASYQAAQAFALFPDQSAAPIGALLFFGEATAGSATIDNTSQGLAEFLDGSTAGGATIVNSGGGTATTSPTTVFYGTTAGSASITDVGGGATVFANDAIGGTAHISNQSSSLLAVGSGATLGSAVIDNQEGGLLLGLDGSLGSATITDGGYILLSGGTAGSATIIVGSGALLGFAGAADGGTAAVTTTDATAQVDLSEVATLTRFDLGSIAGPGTFLLGGNTLAVGALDTDTTVTGEITNGGFVNGVNAASFPNVTNAAGIATLEKDGTGALTLSGTINQTNLVAASGRLIIDGPIIGVGTVVVSSGATVEFGASDAVADLHVSAGGIAQLDDVTVATDPVEVDAGGTISGTGSLTGAVADAGAIVAVGGALDLTGAITGDGALTIEAGATLVLGSAVSGLTPTFAGAGGTLDIQDPADFVGIIDGYAASDVIELAGIGAAAPTYTTIDDGADTTLTFADGASITLAGYDAPGSVTVTAAPVPCYCHGTLILTDGGEVAVESLGVGDSVVTRGGAVRAIRWIGRRSYVGRFIAGRRDILPIVFRAGSLADGIPRRDLSVSPDHAMLLEGVLIPASQLVNGTSVYQDARCRRVDYVHVELDSHDVIFADGAESETFIDDDSRWMFERAAGEPAGSSDAPASYCAPRRTDGYEVENARRAILGRSLEDRGSLAA